MGTNFANEQRPFRFGAATVIIDRELNWTVNRYDVHIARPGPPLKTQIPKVGYHDLVSAAAAGEAAFNQRAAGVLGPTWTSMTSNEREDLWQVFVGGPTVNRWLERHRVSPPLQDQGPDLSMQENTDLQAAAGLSEVAFQSLASAVLGSWWAGLAQVDKDHFYFNFRDT